MPSALMVRRLLDLLSVVDLRLIASGHVHQRRLLPHHGKIRWMTISPV
jgi:hypothetical protein